VAQVFWGALVFPLPVIHLFFSKVLSRFAHWANMAHSYIHELKTKLLAIMKRSIGG